VKRSEKRASTAAWQRRFKAAMIGCAAATAVSGISAVYAEPPATPPKTAEEAEKRLEAEKNALAAKEQRNRELQKDVASIADERREINARLVETAALVQKSEEQMTAIETRLAGFQKQEQEVRDSLAKEHGKISGILAALQRMGRNPPPIIATRREDALQMVRSAMLLGVVFPGLRDEARALSAKLTELVAITTSIRREGDNLRAERERLTTTQTRLSSLLESKKQSLAERQTELQQVRDATMEISKNVSDLSDLIAKLSRQVSAAPQAPQPEPADRVAVLPPAAPEAPPPAVEGVPAARDTAIDVSPPSAPDGPKEVAMLTPPAGGKAPSSIVEMAPSATGLMPGNPDRISPAVPFQSAKGKLPLPARGRKALGFGDKTQYGGTSKGIVLETRFDARVTSPCDGWVVYAGEFRSYGQLLIINAGGGYHVLIAGLSQMDVGPGQFVLAAEPIGTMSSAPRTAQLATEKTGMGQVPKPSSPVLYIEFRKDGQPVDSTPWWAPSDQKVLE
jgi:septal ring factor EnvC (AmiA/AmiB activator)